MEKVVATINGSRTEVSKRGSNLVRVSRVIDEEKKERKKNSETETNAA